MDCSKFLINYQLKQYFNDFPNPSKLISLMKNMKSVSNDTFQTQFNISNINNFYNVKILPVNTKAIHEKNILQIISQHMDDKYTPLLFPYIYTSFSFENKMYMITQHSKIKLSTLLKLPFSVEWWVELLYQTSMAVKFLENIKINHNNLVPENIAFQSFDKDPNKLAIMLINFNEATIDQFILGKDMLKFLRYVIDVLPKQLVNLLFPLILKNIPSRATSGDEISKLLIVNFPSL